jgi:hypothetical protein
MIWALGIAAVVVVAYLALLGWHAEKELDPATGNETGPYQAWQVGALVLALGAVAFGAGWRGRPGLVTVIMPLAITAFFSADAATAEESDGLWVIGAVLVAAGSLLGTGVVAYIGARLRHSRQK